ncbi:hypothetical protein Taro_009354 [Colocasia esculenta]|uniref:CCHC-type domain-containing protein n=1 Tax=Colocasia esculenta TaxID=4460 RepID=A0A843U3T3_COLES|nr:hypothetical protein [Colocasia esculenta]
MPPRDVDGVDPRSSRESTSVQQKQFSPKGVDPQFVLESTLTLLESTPAKVGVDPGLQNFWKFLIVLGELGTASTSCVLKKNQAKGETSKNEEVTCFECRKPGHIRPECPELKKKKAYTKGNGKTSKKKALAAWSDEDTSTGEESEEEIANLCLMAKSDHEKFLIVLGELGTASTSCVLVS